MLGVELLAGAIEIVHHWQDLTEGGAGDLQALILAVTGLALAEIVEVGRQTHVLAIEVVVLALECAQFCRQLGGSVDCSGAASTGMGNFWAHPLIRAPIDHQEGFWVNPWL
jgi:hypothetical protein